MHLLQHSATQSVVVILLWCRGKPTNQQKRKTTDKMKNSIKTIMAALLVTGTLTINASAATTAEQTVTYEVTAINELSVSSPTVSLTVNAASAGSAPTAASDASTSYAITTNESNRKITGALNTAMPSGVSLSASLAAPAGATSVGAVALTGSAQDLVTGISTLNESGKVITYNLSATSAAGVVPSASKTVTLTVTAGA